MKRLMEIVLLSTVFFATTACPAEDTYRATVEGGTQFVRIVGGNYYFKPDHIIVRVNTPVELSVKVEDGIVPHSFVIKSAEAGMVVEEDLSSEAKTIRFTPTAVGSYPFYCTNRLLFFQSHREKGMEGMLEVVE